MEGRADLLRVLEDNFRESQALIRLLEGRIALCEQFNDGATSIETIKLQEELRLETTRQQLLTLRRVELQNDLSLLREPSHVLSKC